MNATPASVWDCLSLYVMLSQSYTIGASMITIRNCGHCNTIFCSNKSTYQAKAGTVDVDCAAYEKSHVTFK